MDRKIRIGIFGIGHNHAAAAITTLRARKDVEIVGLCENDSAVLERRLQENSAAYREIPVMTKEELFDSALDAAMVEAAVPELVPTALECARQGLHLHMDKPAGTDLAAYQELLALLEQNHLVFQTGYMYRYNAGIRYIFQKIRENALGRIYNISAQMSTKHPVWFKEQLKGYGVKAPVMYIFGGHLLDLCMQIKGEPDAVQPFHFCSGNDGMDLEDTSLAVLSYGDGVATVKVSSSEINGWGLREFTVYGEKGTIAVQPLENPLVVRETWLENQSPWSTVYTEVDIPEAGRYDVMMQEFVEMIRGDIPCCVDFHHEYLLQKYTLLACGYPVDKTTAGFFHEEK